MRRRLFKGDHPNVATSLNNLASLYQVRGLASAEPLFKDALDMRRRLAKGDHPDVAQFLNNLAVLYQVRGDHQRGAAVQGRPGHGGGSSRATTPT